MRPTVVSTAPALGVPAVAKRAGWGRRAISERVTRAATNTGPAGTASANAAPAGTESTAPSVRGKVLARKEYWKKEPSAGGEDMVDRACLTESVGH